MGFPEIGLTHGLISKLNTNEYSMDEFSRNRSDRENINFGKIRFSSWSLVYKTTKSFWKIRYWKSICPLSSCRTSNWSWIITSINLQTHCTICCRKWRHETSFNVQGPVSFSRLRVGSRRWNWKSRKKHFWNPNSEFLLHSSYSFWP